MKESQRDEEMKQLEELKQYDLEKNGHRRRRILKKFVSFYNLTVASKQLLDDIAEEWTIETAKLFLRTVSIKYYDIQGFKYSRYWQDFEEMLPSNIDILEQFVDECDQEDVNRIIVKIIDNPDKARPAHFAFDSLSITDPDFPDRFTDKLKARINVLPQSKGNDNKTAIVAVVCGLIVCGFIAGFIIGALTIKGCGKSNKNQCFDYCLKKINPKK